MYAKLSKCSFFQSEVPFLGHVVSAEGLRMDDSQVAIIREWPSLRNTHEVRSFLGLACFRRFVRPYAHIAAPLHALTGTSVPCVCGGGATVRVRRTQGRSHLNAGSHTAAP